MYWSKDDDIANLAADDKLYKIRSLQNALSGFLHQFGFFSKDFSIGEQMVSYFGRHSIKIFTHGKPIRFGYKNLVLASNDGYPLKLETYMGANKSEDSEQSLDP